MTVKNIIEAKKNEVAAVEVWQYTNKDKRLHTDYITNIDEIYGAEMYENLEADSYYVMDESDYDSTICANGDSANFAEWYGNKNAKVLVIMLDCSVIMGLI